MLDLKFRKLMLTQPDLVRRSILSPRQVQLVSVVRQRCKEIPGWPHSGEIALLSGTSVASVSQQLKRLVDAGYLKRRKRVADSGGMEYVYAPAFET